jgi:hypothetical protein
VHQHPRILTKTPTREGVRIMAAPDFTISVEGDVCLLCPNNVGAAAWIEAEARARMLEERWYEWHVVKPLHVTQLLRDAKDAGLMFVADGFGTAAPVLH